MHFCSIQWYPRAPCKIDVSTKRQMMWYYVINPEAHVTLDVMYDVPTREDVSEVIIDRGLVEGRKKAQIKKIRSSKVEKKDAA